MTSQHPILFNDGHAYERAMGIWSQLVGYQFLDWLAPSSGRRWLDVGCGNGAFTELLVQRRDAAEIVGIDPSEAPLAFACGRSGALGASLLHGDAMAVPFSNDRFEVSVMALVLFFVPDPAKGVSEMRRVTCPGGTVAAYIGDDLNGGSPLAPVVAEMKTLGISIARPPRAHIFRIDALRQLWADAGLAAVDTRSVTAAR